MDLEDDLPDHFVFSIQCHDASHAPRIAFIDLLTHQRALLGREYVWLGSNPNSTSGTRNSRRSMLLIDEDDQPTDRDVSHGGGKVIHRLSERRHFELKCPLCGLEVRTRGEVLDQVLDELRAAAEPSLGDTRWTGLPLGLLAAKVSSK